MLAPTRDDQRPESQGGVSLWYIATRLGVSTRSPDWILNYVRLLIAEEGFPKAFPYFGLNAKRRTGITIHSRWNREAVDAWFGTFLPPALVTVVEERRQLVDGQLLDLRAEALAGASARGENAGELAGVAASGAQR